jgi:hypothetical protein
MTKYSKGVYTKNLTDSLKGQSLSVPMRLSDCFMSKQMTIEQGWGHHQMLSEDRRRHAIFKF